MMRQYLARAGAAASFIACFLAGCADLEVHKVSLAESSAPITGKFTYFLPRTALNIAVSATVEKCGPFDPDHTPVPLKVNIAGLVTPTIQADPDQEYWIDYDAARSWFKAINFTVSTSPTKLLTGFNGQINDQAGPIAVATLQTRADVAAAAMIPGVAEVHGFAEHRHGGAPAVPDVCDEKITSALAQIAKLESEETSLYDRIDWYRQGLGSHPYLPKDDPTIIWTNAVATIEAKISDLKSKSLTRKRTFQWLPAHDAFMSSGSYEFSAVGVPTSALVRSFLNRDSGIQKWFDEKPAAADRQFAPWFASHAPYLTILAMDSRGFFADTAAEEKKAFLANDPVKGLIIRQPLSGSTQPCKPDITATLVFSNNQWAFQSDQEAADNCMKAFDQTTVEDTTGGSSSSRSAIMLPQFGQFTIYDVHSSLFENANLTLTLNADGSIQSVGTSDSSTAAQALTNVGTAATTIQSGETARNTAATAANTATTTQVAMPDTINKALADCLSQAKSVVAQGLKPAPCQ